MKNSITLVLCVLLMIFVITPAFVLVRGGSWVLGGDKLAKIGSDYAEAWRITFGWSS